MSCKGIQTAWHTRAECITQITEHAYSEAAVGNAGSLCVSVCASVFMLCKVSKKMLV